MVGKGQSLYKGGSGGWWGRVMCFILFYFVNKKFNIRCWKRTNIFLLDPCGFKHHKLWNDDKLAVMTVLGG